MTFTDIVFYLISAIILITASSAVFSTRIRAALASTTACLLTITIIFFLLGSDYIALTHLLIFSIVTIGIIIYSFHITGNLNNTLALSGSMISLLIITVFSALVAGNLLATKWKEIPLQQPGMNIWEITKLMQTEYILPTLVIAVIIFIGIIGSTYKAGKN